LDGFHSGKYSIVLRAFVGVMQAEISFFGDKTGGVTIQWKEHEYVNLSGH
jgi:hypothetical protein